MSDCFATWICHIAVEIVFGINLHQLTFHAYFVSFGKKLTKLNSICIDHYGYKA